MKTATVRYLGKQSGFGCVPDFDLYNILKLSSPSKALTVGSSVTLNTIRNEGFDPIIEVTAVPVTLKVGAL